jgi:hypothetical protein
VVSVGLFALAGFLAGGVYSLWRSSRAVAIVLGVAAAAATATGVVWLL